MEDVLHSLRVHAFGNRAYEEAIQMNVLKRFKRPRKTKGGSAEGASAGNGELRQVTFKDRAINTLGNIWDRRPRWPGFAKLFGPGLLLLTITLLASELFLIISLRPNPVGREVALSEVYRAARQCRVESAKFLDLDSVILLEVYDAPPSLAPVAIQPNQGPPGVQTGEGEGPPVCGTSPQETALAATQAEAQAKAAAEQAQLAQAQASQNGSKGRAAQSPAPPPPVPVVDIPKPKAFWSQYPTSDSETTVIVQELFSGGAKFEFDPQTSKARIRFIAQFLVPLLILAAVFSLFFLVITGQGGGAADFLGFSKFAANVQRRRRGVGHITFNDVAAIEEGIGELQEVVEYLTNPGKFAELGARAPKGVLLVGPPGTGKTLLAKAVAGEANVPFIQLSGSEFVESLVGVGAARVRDLFKQARNLAPCIVFIDELDAAGRQRGAGMGQGNDEREQTLNQLLVEMDGFNTALGICIMGATNRPDILDPALLRPGRFDRQIVIDVPDWHGRLGILKVHARTRPMDPNCNLEQIAKQTPGFTGADLANILNEAALMAVRRAHSKITHEDLEEAVDRVVAGPERRSHILTEEEKALIAYHEAGHAVVARGAGQETGVLKLSIIARGLQLGHASTFSVEDRLILTRSELEGQITTLLGGLAAEKLVFAELTTGNTKDLEKATTLARKLVATYGMSEKIGRMQVLHEGQVFMGRDFSSMVHTSMRTLDTVDDEMKKILDACEKRALEICQKNVHILHEIVKELLEAETLTGPELDPFLSKVELIEIPHPASARVRAGGNGSPARTKRHRRSSTLPVGEDVNPSGEVS